MLLDSIHKQNVFTEQEIQSLESSIADICTISEHVTDGKMYARVYEWDFYSENAQKIKNILEPKLPVTTVTQSHILDSFYPYEIHTDVKHNNDKVDSEYTVIIPLENYNSETVVFNEHNEHTNEFEDFKQSYSGSRELKIPIDMCLKLTHLHPKDLKYLSIKETFQWSKGSLFAFDRKYYHCSDNHLKSLDTSKRAILLWTSKQ